MSGQIGSNSEDDVDFVPSTNVEEIQSVSNTLDENQNTGRKRTSRAWDHFTRQEINGKIKQFVITVGVSWWEEVLRGLRI
jgi:hypothetical protein